MRRFTSFLLTMLLAVIAIPIQAAIQANVVIDEEYSSLAELEGKTFAIVNKETGKALYGSTMQNLGYDILANAFLSRNSGYYFKLDTPKADAEDETITNFHLLRLQTPAGEPYSFAWGEGYLNSQPAGEACSFILGLNNQNGQDIKNGAVWDIQYVEGKGFTLLNKGTGLYLNDNAPAKYEEPVYWTFCTLKNDWLSAFQPLFDEETTIKAHGTSEEANATYDAIVNPIKANVESGTITDPETDLATIDAALTDLAKAQTTAGAIFTRVIANATINGADGWTIERPVGGNGPLLNGSAFEYWAGNASDRTQASFDYYQVIEGLPNGAYTVSADMYNSLNGEEGAVFSPTSGVYGKSGEYESVQLVDVEGGVLNTYTTGNVLVEDGTIRIGIKSTVIPVAARWFVADNFQLTYNGPVATDEELAPLTAEIANAKLLGVDVTAWEGKTYTASEIDAAVKAIKVAEYNTVIAAYPINAGTLIPAFDAWEGGMVANKGQHWDGTATSTYYEQTSDEWGKDSWTNSKTTTVNLPKGKYVIYAAGRNSAGDACSSYIKVNETTQIFPAKGDTGFGIATDGTATFDPSATYANNNVGRGFEYRFIAFEVTADEGEEITLTVGGEATAAHQWMSICTPVLLTTSDNSAIAKQVLTSDIAAAQAIVDAKAGVGEGLFLIPEEALNTFAAAVDAAKTANENSEATIEEINTAIAELAAATETYKNTPVNAPAADKQYTLTLFATDGTELFPLSIATGKISIEEVGTPVTFVAKENGTYALSNGTEEIYYSNSANNWDLDATAEGGYAWTITAIADGKYNIIGKNGRFLGTNANDKAAGSKCYGDKKADNGSYIWAISEYVAPVEPDPNLIEIAQSQGKELDTFARTEFLEGEEYNTYTANADLQIGMKMMNIDVADCDYIVIKFAEEVEAGWKLGVYNGNDLLDIPAGTKEFKYVFADDPKCEVANGVLPQICMMTFFGGYTAPLVAKVEGVYKHKVASEPELAAIADMKLTVAEDASIDEKDKTFPIVFNFNATLDESVNLPNGMPSGEITYTITAEGKEPIQGSRDFDPTESSKTIYAEGLDYESEYTITINSLTISSTSVETWETSVLLSKTFEDGELSLTFTTNAAEPQPIEKDAWYTAGEFKSNDYVDGEKVSTSETRYIVDPTNAENTCIIVTSHDKAAYDYDTQLFIISPIDLKPGSEVTVSMKVRADVAKAGCATQAHAEPGNYIHWACMGNVDFTTEWKEFTTTFTVTADMSTAEKTMKTIAINLDTVDGTANNFYFDDIVLTVPTVGIDGINAAAKSNRKVVENGRVVIYKNGVKTMSSGVSIR